MNDMAAVTAAKAHKAIMDMADAFREAGAMAERERIIALLEGAECTVGENEGCLCGSYSESIALIKGDNK